ncbi:MAG TPA: hypothetical protein DCL77_06490 [Prolixibacteraceae bacterium]|nr:hypothetical protein [Prolixibacteraceae bacterium]
MKKIYSIIVLLIMNIWVYSQEIPQSIVSVSEAENQFTITFNLPNYIVKDTSLLSSYNIPEIFKYIDIDYFGNIDDIGYPELPQLTFDLKTPTQSSNFQISVSNQITQDITLNHRFMPSQDELETDTTFTIINDYYTSDGTIYNSSSAISEPYIVMGQTGVSVSIFPFKYNPQLNKITVLRQATFTINYTSLKGAEIPNPSPIQSSFLSSFFENYPQLKSASTSRGRYLMVTPPRFENRLKCFANYKRNIGYEVNVVSTATIGSSFGQIKSYIQSQYNSIATRPDYILLVGDLIDIPAADGNPTGNSIDNPITDIQYATLEGDDYFADAFLGRFSVSTEDELQYIINKSIYMETNIHLLAKKAKFLAGESGSWFGAQEDQFENGHRDIVKNTFEPNGYICQKLYQPTYADAFIALNDNPLYYLYSGHGNAEAWMGGTFKIYVNTSFSDIKQMSINTVYPFVFAFACRTGNFASANSIAKDWIRQKNGGVTYFGSSVDSKGSSDNAIEREIFGDAFTYGNNISNIITLGKSRYYKRFWSKTNRERSRRYMKAYNLLGDPSLNTRGIGCINEYIFTNDEIFYSGSNIAYKASTTIQNNVNFVLESNSNVTLVAGNSIKLNPGFKTNLGAIFQAKIAPCNNGQ